MVPLNILTLRNSSFWPDISFRKQLADKNRKTLSLVIINSSHRDRQRGGQKQRQTEIQRLTENHKLRQRLRLIERPIQSERPRQANSQSPKIRLTNRN